MSKLFSIPIRSTARIVSCILMIGVLLAPSIVHAQDSSDDINSMVGGTPFYDPNASICAGTSTGGAGQPVSVTGNNAKTAYDFFVANGFTPVAASGIVGNLYYESIGVNPTQGQIGGGGGYGIAQWTPPTAMIAWVTAKGGNPNALGGTGQIGQLDFLLYDFKNNDSQAYNQVKGDVSVVAATTDFMNGYERPGVPALSTRISDAQAIYTKYSGSSVTSTSGTGGNCSNAGGPVDAAGCSNPWAKAHNLGPERIDMGVDYSASAGSPILAICPGVVTGVAAHGTGWISPTNTQGCVYVKINSGTYSGKSYYVCEDIAPTVHVGQTVQAGQQIATFLPSPTGLETGWGSGTPYGALAAQLNQQCGGSDPGCWATAAGVSFNKLIIATGGKSGIFVPGAPHQNMPPGYP